MWRDTQLPASSSNVRVPSSGRGRTLSALVAAAVTFWAIPAAATPLQTALGLLERGYLFYAELDPPKLLRESLAYTEARVPGLIATELGPRTHLVEAGECQLRVELGPDARILDLTEPLEEIASLIRACTKPPEDEDAPAPESVLLRGALSALDPYSTVLDARGQTEHRIQFQGKLAGIGARIGIRDDRLTLITVYPDSPADRAGLRNDDVVLRIDSLSATNIMVGDAVQHIRGAEGTEVVLRIEREGEAEPLDVTVTRGVVMIPSVTTRKLDGGIVLAEISHFSQTTPEDFRSHIQELLDEEPVAGLVIDLRRNSGGSMLGSASIGDLFLRQGILITTAGRHGQPARGLAPEITATPATPFANIPVAFLTSPRTASGSELLAASLRNHDRAIFVGERSYGKGTIQKTYGLGPSSTLKMTVGHFLPNGKPIPGGGLVPDVELQPYRFGRKRVALPPTLSSEELPFWLALPRWAEQADLEPRFAIPWAQDLTPEEEEAEEHPKPVEDEEAENEGPDPALEVAAEILRRFGSTSADRMLRAASPWLEGRVRDAEQEIQRFMERHEIDWVRGLRPATPADLTVTMAATPPLAAGVESTVRVTVRNNGATPLFRVRGRLEATGLLSHKSLVFGRIDPGDEQTWEVRVDVPKGVHTQRIAAHARLFDDFGEISRLGPVQFAVEGAPRPRLAYAVDIRATDDENVLDLLVRITNRGSAALEDFRVRLEHPRNGDFEIIEGMAELEAIPPGAVETRTFRVRLLETFRSAPKAELVMGEADYGIYANSEVALEPSVVPGPWHEPPTIEIAGFSGDPAAGEARLAVVASDDEGLARVYASIDEDVVAHVDPDGAAATEVRLMLPWDPRQEVRRYRIVATDREGLSSGYMAGL